MSSDSDSSSYETDSDEEESEVAASKKKEKGIQQASSAEESEDEGDESWEDESEEDESFDEEEEEEEDSELEEDEESAYRQEEEEEEEEDEVEEEEESDEPMEESSTISDAQDEFSLVSEPSQQQAEPATSKPKSSFLEEQDDSDESYSEEEESYSEEEEEEEEEQFSMVSEPSTANPTRLENKNGSDVDSEEESFSEDDKDEEEFSLVSEPTPEASPSEAQANQEEADKVDQTQQPPQQRVAATTKQPKSSFLEDDSDDSEEESDDDDSDMVPRQPTQEPTIQVPSTNVADQIIDKAQPDKTPKSSFVDDDSEDSEEEDDNDDEDESCTSDSGMVPRHEPSTAATPHADHSQAPPPPQDTKDSDGGHHPSKEETDPPEITSKPSPSEESAQNSSGEEEEEDDDDDDDDDDDSEGSSDEEEEDEEEEEEEETKKTSLASTPSDPKKETPHDDAEPSSEQPLRNADTEDDDSDDESSESSNDKDDEASSKERPPQTMPGQGSSSDNDDTSSTIEQPQQPAPSVVEREENDIPDDEDEIVSEKSDDDEDEVDEEVVSIMREEKSADEAVAERPPSPVAEALSAKKNSWMDSSDSSGDDDGDDGDDDSAASANDRVEQVEEVAVPTSEAAAPQHHHHQQQQEEKENEEEHKAKSFTDDSSSDGDESSNSQDESGTTEGVNIPPESERQEPLDEPPTPTDTAQSLVDDSTTAKVKTKSFLDDSDSSENDSDEDEDEENEIEPDPPVAATANTEPATNAQSPIDGSSDDKDESNVDRDDSAREETEKFSEKAETDNQADEWRQLQPHVDTTEKPTPDQKKSSFADDASSDDESSSADDESLKKTEPEPGRLPLDQSISVSSVFIPDSEDAKPMMEHKPQEEEQTHRQQPRVEVEVNTTVVSYKEETDDRPSPSLGDKESVIDEFDDDATGGSFEDVLDDNSSRSSSTAGAKFKPEQSKVDQQQAPELTKIDEQAHESSSHNDSSKGSALSGIMDFFSRSFSSRDKDADVDETKPKLDKSNKSEDDKETAKPEASSKGKSNEFRMTAFQASQSMSDSSSDDDDDIDGVVIEAKDSSEVDVSEVDMSEEDEGESWLDDASSAGEDLHASVAVMVLESIVEGEEDQEQGQSEISAAEDTTEESVDENMQSTTASPRKEKESHEVSNPMFNVLKEHQRSQDEYSSSSKSSDDDGDSTSSAEISVTPPPPPPPEPEPESLEASTATIEEYNAKEFPAQSFKRETKQTDAGSFGQDDNESSEEIIEEIIDESTSTIVEEIIVDGTERREKEGVQSIESGKKNFQDTLNLFQRMEEVQPITATQDLDELGDVVIASAVAKQHLKQPQEQQILSPPVTSEPVDGDEMLETADQQPPDDIKATIQLSRTPLVDDHENTATLCNDPVTISPPTESESAPHSDGAGTKVAEVIGVVGKPEPIIPTTPSEETTALPAVQPQPQVAQIPAHPTDTRPPPAPQSAPNTQQLSPKTRTPTDLADKSDGCANCHKHKSQDNGTHFKYCGFCKQVKYCSRHCQKKHWKQHKSFCETQPRRTKSRQHDGAIHEGTTVQVGAIAATEAGNGSFGTPDVVMGLQVGSECYYCNRLTLVNEAGSYFALRFGDGGERFTESEPKYDSEGRQLFFIDRDGALFRYILSYLRTGSVFLPPFDKNPDLWRALRAEAEFFSLEGLSRQLYTTQTCPPTPEHQGILHWLGTERRTRVYQNPMSMGAISVTMNKSSSSTSDEIPVLPMSLRETLVQYHVPCHPTEAFQPALGVVPLASTSHFSMVLMDLKLLTVSPSHVTLRNALLRGCDALVLEGSQDGSVWQQVHCIHASDILVPHGTDLMAAAETIDRSAKEFGFNDALALESMTEYAEQKLRQTWEIQPKTEMFYRYFRFSVSSISGEDVFAGAVGLEIYGDVHEA